MRHDELQGKGFFGWLGRQVGHVRKALTSDPGAKRVYRNESVEEKPLPNDASVKLRRTTIDEVIVAKKQSSEHDHGLH
jgi:hypothetical protein